MASSKEYLEFILGQLAELDEITYRAMMAFETASISKDAGAVQLA